MLKNIDPILGPELLATLRAMGHGDEIAIVDGNYPAQSHAQRLIRADGISLIPMLTAILSVLPLDEAVEKSAVRTCNSNHPDTDDPIHVLIDQQIPTAQLEISQGDLFYDRVKQCHTVVATSEPALFANVILRKGVI